MNKQLFCLFALLCCTTTIYADTYGVGIFNDGTGVAVGLIDYTSPGFSATTQLYLPNLNYIGNSSLSSPNTQVSSYNYATKQLTFLAYQPNNSTSPVIVTVDCNKWKVVSNVAAPVSYLAGFAYDQSNSFGQNMFTTFKKAEDGYLYVAKINPVNLQISNYDAFQGFYLTSATDDRGNYFLVYFNNFGYYIRIYNSAGQFAMQKTLTFGNAPSNMQSGPINMAYSTKDSNFMATFMLKNDDGSLSSTLAWMDWSTGTFNFTSILSNHGFTATANVADPNQNLVYIFGSNPSTSFMLTFDTSSNDLMAIGGYTQILAAF
ncbi:hypothetical protein CYY_001134 [Polysphondylium violaceum]|uniref:Uncharacterized protein n=1 Tax=Polysphondylium violaceum TaxID=133409 RepID=A0A8J4VAX0_9MYCE|nr:hypothetical protein CYY_001134 [Polysphondylium violaceum]